MTPDSFFITKKKKKITAPCLSSLPWEERVLNSGDKQSYTFSSCFVCLLFIIRPDTPRKRGCVLLFTQATVDTQLGRCHHRNLPFKAPSERHMVNSIKISHLGKKKTSNSPRTLAYKSHTRAVWTFGVRRVCVAWEVQTKKAVCCSSVLTLAPKRHISQAFSNEAMVVPSPKSQRHSLPRAMT